MFFFYLASINPSAVKSAQHMHGTVFTVYAITEAISRRLLRGIQSSLYNEDSARAPLLGPPLGQTRHLQYGICSVFPVS